VAAEEDYSPERLLEEVAVLVVQLAFVLALTGKRDEAEEKLKDLAKAK
jgi:hypothetical protein